MGFVSSNMQNRLWVASNHNAKNTNQTFNGGDKICNNMNQGEFKALLKISGKLSNKKAWKLNFWVLKSYFSWFSLWLLYRESWLAFFIRFCLTIRLDSFSFNYLIWKIFWLLLFLNVTNVRMRSDWYRLSC